MITNLKRGISEERSYNIILRPVVTEKTTILTQYNQHAFDVAIDASKPEIKAAIEMIFKVNVLAVNVVNRPGKVKRFKGRLGKRSDYKRAYVSIKGGQVIDTGAGA
jgi:large subunit ribosomal protein L23